MTSEAVDLLQIKVADFVFGDFALDKHDQAIKSSTDGIQFWLCA